MSGTENVMSVMVDGSYMAVRHLNGAIT